MKNINILSISLLLALTMLNSSAAAAKEFIVAIDKGHSAEQPGAISSRGEGEYSFNKKIAEGVQARIAAQHCKIKAFLIISSDDQMPLAVRAKLAAEKKADLLISIHHDSVQPELLSYWQVNGKEQHFCDKHKGFSIFYSELNGHPYESLLFSTFLGSEMLKDKFIPTLHHAEKIRGENKPLVDAEKGIYKYNELKLLKEAQMPAVLIESGIIVNRDEEVALKSAEYQDKLIKSITRAIIDYAVFRNNN